MRKIVLVLMIFSLLFLSVTAFAGGGGGETAKTGKPFEE